MEKLENSYLCEIKLYQKNKELHKRYSQSILFTEYLLEQYKIEFPEFTDHSILHVMNVIELSNQIMNSGLEELNGEELYIYLMGALLHDIGMGLPQNDYKRFLTKMGMREKIPLLEEEEKRHEIIRQYHNEFSKEFIKSYWELFDIPNKKYAEAIEALVRGHRKVSFLNPLEFPVNYKVSSQATIRLPYLAAVLKTADELDISRNRILPILYDNIKINNGISKIEFAKHKAVKFLEIKGEEVIVVIDSESDLLERIIEMCKKLNETIKECKEAVKKTTTLPFQLERVVLKQGDERIVIDESAYKG